MGLPQLESNQHDRSTPQRKKPSHWERAEQRSNRTYIEVEKGHDRSITESPDSQKGYELICMDRKTQPASPRRQTQPKENLFSKPR